MMDIVFFSMIFFGVLVAIVMTVLGQFLRIPVGDGAGVLLLDLWIPLLGMAWMLKKCASPIARTDLLERGEKFLKKPFFIGIFGFLGVATGSLFWNAQYFDTKTLLESGFYLFRYTFLLLFLFVVFDEVNTVDRIKTLLKAFFFSSVVLVILGFFQLLFFPNFTVMQEYGWDPHINRLLSTWFDPNFFGGFLAFSISFFLGLLVFSSIFKQPPSKLLSRENIPDFILLTTSAIFFLALLLTLSRSGFLAFLVVALLFGLFFFRKLFVVGVLALILILPLFPKSFERISDGAESMHSTLYPEETLFLPDATARLRLGNIKEGLQMATVSPIIGVGFNTLRFHRSEKIHSSGGFDASLLTVLVTTGYVGLFFFLLFWGGLIWEGIKIFKDSQRLFLQRGLGIGFSIGALSILAHSFFVNSLFFSPLLVFFFGIFGLLLAKGWDTNEDHSSLGKQ